VLESEKDHHEKRGKVVEMVYFEAEMPRFGWTATRSGSLAAWIMDAENRFHSGGDHLSSQLNAMTKKMSPLMSVHETLSSVIWRFTCVIPPNGYSLEFFFKFGFIFHIEIYEEIALNTGEFQLILCDCRIGNLVGLVRIPLIYFKNVVELQRLVTFDI
jgi:hypothetical protein